MLKTLNNIQKVILYFVTNKINPDDLYRIIGSLYVDKKTGIPLVNMGYWKDCKEADKKNLYLANQKMFELVGDAALLSEKDQIVADIGCGFSSNMIHCAQRYKAKKYIGLNLAKDQIAVGNSLIKKYQLEDKVETIYGSATEMPFETMSVDKMLSVEAAFHFHPREDFFKEAYRCLKHEGILSMSDLVFNPANSWMDKIKLWSVKKGLHVPESNIYNISSYIEKLEQSGFEVLSCTSIKHEVVPHFFKWFLGRPLRELLSYNLIFSLVSLGFLFYPLEYIHLVAQKK